MPVGMVHVGRVCVLVAQACVPMPMGMRLTRRIIGTVGMPVMRVVHVRMRVFHHFVLMLMLVLLGQVKPDANSHKQACGKELHRDRLSQKQNRCNRSDKWRGGEVGASAGRAEVTERTDEQGEAHAIAKKAHETRD